MEVFQDGPDFYNAQTDELVASFPELVKGDSDMAGAMLARHEFKSRYPSARMVG